MLQHNVSYSRGVGVVHGMCLTSAAMLPCWRDVGKAAAAVIWRSPLSLLCLDREPASKPHPPVDAAGSALRQAISTGVLASNCTPSLHPARIHTAAPEAAEEASWQQQKLS